VDPTDGDDPQKRFAAVLLGIRADPAGLAALVDAALHDRAPRVRAAATEALGAFPDALPTVEAALADSAPAVRAAALRALGESTAPKAVELLTARVGGGGDEARLAVLALGGTELGRAALAGVELTARTFLPSEDPAPPPPAGRAWYVDATAGDDANPGDAKRPFRTLAPAVERLGPGDRLHATAGADGVPFRERVLIPAEKGGTASAPTRVEHWEGRPAPILDGFGDDRGTPGPGIGLQVEAPYVHVVGWFVRGWDESGIHLGGAHGAIVDCTVERCERHGIFAYYAPHATIVRPTVRDCAAQGISLRSSPFAVVAGGSSRDNGIDGLLLLQDSDQVVVTGFASTGNNRGIGVMERSDGVRLVDVYVEGNRSDRVIAHPGCDVAEFGARAAP